MSKSVGSAGLMMLLIVLSGATNALAYVDPNTTRTILTGMGPLLSVLGVILGIILWPILFLRKGLEAWFRNRSISCKITVLLTTCVLIVAVYALVYKLIR